MISSFLALCNTMALQKALTVLLVPLSFLLCFRLSTKMKNLVSQLRFKTIEYKDNGLNEELANMALKTSKEEKAVQEMTSKEEQAVADQDSVDAVKFHDGRKIPMS